MGNILNVLKTCGSGELNRLIGLKRLNSINSIFGRKINDKHVHVVVLPSIYGQV